MSSNPDQFFEEEEELARKDARPAVGATKAKRAAAPTSASGRSGGAPTGKAAAPSDHRPPSFALVVAIALVALLLGICIGYFFAMSVVGGGSTAGDASAASQQSVVAASSDASSMAVSTGDSAEMPAGHPDISSMMNEDGTVNQEAVDAYKAQLAAAQGESGQEDTASSGDGSSR